MKPTWGVFRRGQHQPPKPGVPKFREEPTHQHLWSKWLVTTWPGRFCRVCLHPNCAAREDT